MLITVCHNVATDARGRGLNFDGYSPHHPLVPVFQYTEETPLNVTRDRVLEATFHLFNVGDDPAFGTPDTRAVQYRARRNRSLSVGDVISLTCPVPTINAQVQLRMTKWFTCASVGWTELPSAPTSFAHRASTPGTTALDTYQEV
jgi:hypothetical protein